MTLREVKRNTWDRFKLVLAAIKKKRFIKNYKESFKVMNVGGADIVKDDWRNLDFHSIHYNYPSVLVDYNVDLEKRERWPIENNSYDLVYCSHLLEHLSQETVEFSLREIHRILKSGGGIRIVVPNINLALRHYGDEEWWKIHFHRMDWRDAFLDFFASSLVGKLNYDKNLELDYYTNQITDKSQENNPGNHRNWFTFKKLKRLLEEAGFTEIEESQHRQSRFTEFCKKGVDKTAKELSLYVDASKKE